MTNAITPAVTTATVLELSMNHLPPHLRGPAMTVETSAVDIGDGYLFVVAEYMHDTFPDTEENPDLLPISAAMLEAQELGAKYLMFCPTGQIHPDLIQF